VIVALVFRASSAVVLGAVVSVVAGCGASPGRAEVTRPPGDTAVVNETFLTPFDTIDNVDSPAIYHGGDTHLVFASAKTTDAVIVYDGVTGALVKRLGTGGTGDGQLRRPNGLAVADSVLFVVERDNHRVQAFHLPSLRPLGAFGGAELRSPYGVAWIRNGAHAWSVYVTDNYEAGEDSIPPDRELGARVRQFNVRWNGSGIHGTAVRAFGDTAGAGVLRIVESIAADSALGRLLVAEETETDSHIKVYDLEGAFTGVVFGRRLFPQQAEGIALYPCGELRGWWIATDQGDSVNTFHVFDRVTFEHAGSFTGARTRLTDGVAVTSTGFGPFPTGALFASHLDGGLGAISWQEIAKAVGLGKCE
jgi:3-phytase